jgi:hypothetical protein
VAIRNAETLPANSHVPRCPRPPGWVRAGAVCGWWHEPHSSRPEARAGFPSPSRQRGSLFPAFPPVAQIPACSVSNDSTGPADAHVVERALVQ